MPERDEVKIPVAPLNQSRCRKRYSHLPLEAVAILLPPAEAFIRGRQLHSLSNPNIPNPAVIIPTLDITYTVTVRDTIWLYKAIQDSVLKLYGNFKRDASACQIPVCWGQTIMLNATVHSRVYGALTLAEQHHEPSTHWAPWKWYLVLSLPGTDQ